MTNILVGGNKRGASPGAARSYGRSNAPDRPAASPAEAPFAIGVTGHRPARLAGVDLARLEGRIVEVLEAVEAAAPGASFRLVGSLAEGADTIVADAALARGWRVDAVLPFPRDDYADDFQEPGTAERLGQHLAAAGSVFELPGRRDEPGGEAAAYERAGRVMLGQSDMLLAVWDEDQPGGRGGTAQIVAEAVSQGLPVLALPASDDGQPALLWSGFNAHAFGLESIETIARGGLSDLPRMLAAVGAADVPVMARTGVSALGHLLCRPVSLAYPMMLAALGVRGLRLKALPAVAGAGPSPSDAPGIEGRLSALLRPRFEEADRAASAAAQLFRGAFVSNFALAALSVTLSLVGLVIPAALRPVLVIGEFASIASILLVTHLGGRSGWHRRWLDQRRLAERLRCLAVAALLGDLMLRDGGPTAGEERAIARSLRLPTGVVDAAYLAAVHARLLALLDEQIGYLTREAGRMHRLEHRLHRLGAMSFGIVACVCAGVLAIEAVDAALPHRLGEWSHHLPIGITLLSAALPAVGAAIYGIRMQGDFAGAAERNADLAAQLRQLRAMTLDDVPAFDNLRRLVSRTTHLLTRDVAQWFRSSLARPLALPG